MKTKTKQIVMVPLALIKPSPLNPRKVFDEEALKELASTMLPPRGIREPLQLLQNGKKSYEILDGERRYRAAKIAKLKEVPATIEEMTEAEAKTARLISFDQKVDLTPWERAAGYQQLLDDGMSVEDLAAAIGKSVSSVRSIQKLGRAPEVLRDALAQGLVPVETAKLVCAVPAEAMREKLAICVLNGSWDMRDNAKLLKDTQREVLSYRGTKELIHRSCMIELKQAPFDPADAKLVPSAGACGPCPKRVGNLKKIDPEQYAGGRDDVCMDPMCYEAKAQARAAAEVAKAKEQGRKVLSKKECAEAFEKWNNELRWDAPYVDLDRRCPADKKDRTYRELLPKAIAGNLMPEVAQEIVIGIDPSGRSHDLLPAGIAQGILKKQGIAIRVAKPYSPPKPKTPEEQAKINAKRERDDQIRTACEKELCALMGTIASSAAMPASQTTTMLLREAARAVALDLPYSGDAVNQYIAGVLGCGETKTAIEAAIKAEADASKIWTVLCAMIGNNWEIDGVAEERLEQLGYDYRSIKKEVTRRFGAPAEEEKPNKKAKTAASAARST